MIITFTLAIPECNFKMYKQEIYPESILSIRNSEIIYLDLINIPRLRIVGRDSRNITAHDLLLTVNRWINFTNFIHFIINSMNTNQITLRCDKTENIDLKLNHSLFQNRIRQRELNKKIIIIISPKGFNKQRFPSQGLKRKD